MGQDKKVTYDIVNKGFYKKEDFYKLIYSMAGINGDAAPIEDIEKAKVVFLGAGLEQANIGVGDLNVGEGRTVLFELPQALSAVVYLGFALLPGGQKFLYGRLQYLAGELAGLDC